MNSRTEYLLQAGPAGLLEVAIDRPALDAVQRGTAVIAHPHPLFGGTMQNKVVGTLARTFVQTGWTAVRFNFRGIGQSEGSYDNGIGEVQDLLAVIEAQAPTGPLALAGFSFGGFVTASAVAQLHGRREPEKLILVGTAASRFQVPPVPVELHARTLVLHGEQDDTVPLQAALDWARPQFLPVTVIPGVEHFFHGQLTLLKGLAVRHLSQA